MKPSHRQRRKVLGQVYRRKVRNEMHNVLDHLRKQCSLPGGSIVICSDRTYEVQYNGEWRRVEYVPVTKLAEMFSNFTK